MLHRPQKTTDEHSKVKADEGQADRGQYGNDQRVQQLASYELGHDPVDIVQGLGNDGVRLHGQHQVQRLPPEPEKELLILQEIDAHNNAEHQIQQASTNI